MKYRLAQESATGNVLLLWEYEASDFAMPPDVLPEPAKVAEFFGKRALEYGQALFSGIGLAPAELKMGGSPVSIDAAMTLPNALDEAPEAVPAAHVPADPDCGQLEDADKPSEITKEPETIAGLPGWPPPKESDWWVVGTDRKGTPGSCRRILVEDRTSGSKGVIEDFGPDQWAMALNAAASPYKCEDVSGIAVTWPLARRDEF